MGHAPCPLVEEIDHLKEECKRLYELSHTDPLTGFFNLRQLFDLLEKEMERTRRTGLPTGLVMADLDHFKRINDTFGHEAGNKALRWCSEVLRKSIRRIDLPFRYGGEEFAIVLPGTRLSQAVLMTERLRSALEGAKLNLEGSLVQLTASFGVDACGDAEAISAEDFIKRTDGYLLKAKTGGRNRVCHPDIRAQVKVTEVTEEEKEALFRPN
jgi:diguanylate cyclase (GGDEF)-like protein